MTHPASSRNQDRRAFLKGGAALLPTSALMACGLLRPRTDAPGPFTLGVASGDPTPDGMVLWTRLAPEPFGPNGGMANAPVEVRWQITEDPAMARVVGSGSVLANPDMAHSVHVEVSGLRPNRWYWYRFQAMGEISPLGRTRTLPAPNARPDRLRFAFASCQNWEHGLFNAYRPMVTDAPDLIFSLGDYIYEFNETRRKTVRRHAGPEPVTLAQYHHRYAQYRTDPDLQAAHAAAPWIVTWDDHEVDNDYAGATTQDNDPPEKALARRAAAYQAFWENMPLRPRNRAKGPNMRLYRAFDFGRLARFAVTDGRQYRSDHPCQIDGQWGGRIVTGPCPEKDDPRRSMFGAAQEAWLARTLRGSGRRWSILAQAMLIAQLKQVDRQGKPGFWSDGWDAFPAARRRLMDLFADPRTANPVAIGGDIHSFWASQLKRDFDNPRSRPVAAEFVGSSISSNGIPYEPFHKMLPRNPHVAYFESRKRGYVTVDVTPKALTAAFRAVDTVQTRTFNTTTLRTFTVENGRRGIAGV